MTYLRADAQVHPFPPAAFDLCISRFGTMFFADPVAAFTNIGRALRPSARLVMLVRQTRERNEWPGEIRQALGAPTAVSSGAGWTPFSLGDPAGDGGRRPHRRSHVDRRCQPAITLRDAGWRRSAGELGLGVRP